MTSYTEALLKVEEKSSPSAELIRILKGEKSEYGSLERIKDPTGTSLCVVEINTATDRGKAVCEYLRNVIHDPRLHIDIRAGSIGEVKHSGDCLVENEGTKFTMYPYKIKGIWKHIERQYQRQQDARPHCYSL